MSLNGIKKNKEVFFYVAQSYPMFMPVSSEKIYHSHTINNILCLSDICQVTESAFLWYPSAVHTENNYVVLSIFHTCMQGFWGILSTGTYTDSVVPLTEVHIQWFFGTLISITHNGNDSVPTPHPTPSSTKWFSGTFPTWNTSQHDSEVPSPHPYTHKMNLWYSLINNTYTE